VWLRYATPRPAPDGRPVCACATAACAPHGA
jgi:hypothetical protein